ncbi:hypothetical protein [Isobaculum melis]|uniref:Uncharacterized protein n=1 Tax=Isobaculum melis TaxID=142588 RepID=A0A1H9TLD3_9LACT|nr:hypothetical protein [Isobaculum melis]SER97794.1 hypothetical protein SAMN04488559_11443 [Isobaculum melis]
MLINYILVAIIFIFLSWEFYSYKKAKKQGNAVVIRPLYDIGAVVVFLLALYGIFTNQSYDEIVRLVENLFR